MTAANANEHFLWVYSTAHMAAHPDQLVKKVDLLLKKPQAASYLYTFYLAITLRGRDKSLKTEGACRNEGTALERVFRLHCIVECDGGGIRIEPHGDYVMMYLDPIRMITCDQDLNDVTDSGDEIHGGMDDRVFRLNRVEKEPVS